MQSPKNRGRCYFGRGNTNRGRGGISIQGLNEVSNTLPEEAPHELEEGEIIENDVSSVFKYLFKIYIFFG